MKDRIARNPGVFRGMIPTDNMKAVQNGEEFEILLVRNDDPEEEGTPYNKESVLPDDVAEAICPGIEDPTPADAFRELGTSINSVGDSLAAHATDLQNPHQVTCEQVGAVTQEQHEFDIAETKGYVDLVNGVATDAKENVDALLTQFADHKDADNPHGVTPEMIGAATKAIIVTIDGTTPSHTNAQIYNTVINGGSVYLKMWSGTYIRLSWCDSTEAVFEASQITTVTGADGNNYSAQYFRAFRVQNDQYKSNSAIVPNQAYVDAQIQYYLAGKEE